MKSPFHLLVSILLLSTHEDGELKLKATADGLAPATTVVHTQRCALHASVRKSIE